MDTSRKQPSIQELLPVEGVEYHCIKRNEPDVDGFGFLHGVIVAKHKGVLYACWGANKGEENTDTEVVCGCRSMDDGKTWSQSHVWIQGNSGEGVSHGVFLSSQDRLYGFFPHYAGLRENLQMYLHQLREDGTWETVCKVTEEPFWPLGEPVLMENGSYIMPGISVGGPWGSTQNPAAVAISAGNDLTSWRIIPIPKPENMVIWGESGVIVSGSRITCIFRCWHKDPCALVSVSEDFGGHWSVTERTNLAMADSKPSTGVLSSGKAYLIGTTVADGGYVRYPLTVALGDPGRGCFQQIKCLRRHDASIDHPLNENEKMLLAYPYATEADGKLYITYSVGFISGKLHNYNNYAEIAVVDVDKL